MKSNFKNAVYNAIGFIFPVAVGLITTPYIVHKLGTEIYGIYVLAISLIGLISFMDLGFGQGIIKFVSHYEAKGDFERINKIVNTTFIINFLMGMIGLSIIFGFSEILTTRVFKVKEEQISLSILALKIASLGFLINLLSSTFSGIPKAFQRYDIPVKIQNFVWFLSIISSVVLLYLGYSLIEMLLAYTGFQALGLLLYFYYSKRLLPSLKLNLRFNKDVFKEIFRFSIFVSLNTISGNIVMKMDKAIVSYFLGTSAVSFYTIPYNLAAMISSFVGNINQFLFPAISSLNSKGDKEQMRHYFMKALDYTALISSFLMIIFIIFSDRFIYLWLGEDFAKNSYQIAPILGFTFFFSCLTSVSLWYYTALNKTHVNLISSLIGSFSYVIASLFFIPIFGLKGAAISFMFVLLPFPAYNFYISKIVGFSFKEYLSRILLYIILILIATVYTLFLSKRDLFIDIAASNTLLLIAFLLRKELFLELINKIVNGRCENVY
jgi:O-antigen/teichoic acid export membrane protein